MEKITFKNFFNKHNLVKGKEAENTNLQTFADENQTNLNEEQLNTVMNPFDKNNHLISTIDTREDLLNASDNHIFHLEAYNKHFAESEKFEKQRKLYLIHSKQTTFVGIPEFEEIFGQIEKFVPMKQYAGKDNDNCFGNKSILYLADGKKCDVSSFFNVGELKNDEKNQRRYVNVDYALNGYASGIKFTLMEQKWNFITPNSNVAKVGRLSFVQTPNSTLDYSTNYYLDTQWLGKCFISNESNINAHGETVYYYSVILALKNLPINGNTIMLDDKSYIIKFNFSKDYSNLTNPLFILGDILENTKENAVGLQVAKLPKLVEINNKSTKSQLENLFFAYGKKNYSLHNEK